MITAEPGSLLTAKLNRPPVTADLVARPRLLTRLDRGSGGPLTLVCAPAGFGKTTLVSAWAAARAAPPGGLSAPKVAWLAVDEHDSELPVFVGYVVAALRTVFPEACPGTTDLLQATAGFSPAALVTRLSNDLASLPGRTILVLDDYQSLRGAAVHELWRTLLRHWPKPLHLVIVGRQVPPLPLSRPRAQGLLTEIRAWHLRFTAEETEHYLRQVLPRLPDPATVAALDHRMEGWITGLRLATLSMGLAGDTSRLAEALGQTNALVTDYLLDEVLTQQPPAVRRFLLATSLLDRFCEPLCAAVVDGPDPEWPPARCLEWAIRADLFLVPLDDQGLWYRYHHLFGELLAKRAARGLGQDAVAEAHRRAGAWYDQQGLADESARQFLLAGDQEQASRVMEQALRGMLDRQAWPTLARWRHLLPDEGTQAHVGRLMIKAWALQGSWQLESQGFLLDQVEAALAAESSAMHEPDRLRVWRGQLLGLRGQQAYFRNQPDRAVAYCREALALLPPDWRYVRGGATVYQAMGLQMAGRPDEAEQVLAEALATGTGPADAFRLMVRVGACLVPVTAGHLERLRQMAEALLRQAETVGAMASVGWARHFLGTLYYQWNDLAAARAHFSWAVEHYFQATALSAQGSLVGLALSHQAEGESAAAHGVLELLARLELEQRGVESHRTSALRARLALMNGDLAAAARWADGFIAPPADTALLWVDVPHLTRAWILLARGDPDDVRTALELLATLRGMAERTHNVRQQIEILALEAVGLAAQDRADEATASLTAALELARPGGFIRVFVDQGEGLRRLVAALPGRRARDDQMARLLAAFAAERAAHRTGPGAGGNGYVAEALPEPLTPRELDVLTLMRLPCSGREISQRLGISHATYKRHAANVYGKLGVTNRWQAVASAEQLKILPPP